MASEKCCCPAANGLKRMRTVVEEARVRHEGTEESLQCVSIHLSSVGLAEVPNLFTIPSDDGDESLFFYL